MVIAIVASVVLIMAGAHRRWCGMVPGPASGLVHRLRGRWFMSRGMTAGLAVVVLLGTGQEPLHQVAIETRVIEWLNAVADTATVEHGACLYGRVGPDSTVITSIEVPRVVRATPVTLDDEPCRGYPIAYWHVHIPFEYTLMGTRSGARPLEEYCQLSRADMRSAIAAPSQPLMIVGVGRRRFCWWTRAEILQSMNDQGVLPAMLDHAPGRYIELPKNAPRMVTLGPMLYFRERVAARR